MLFPQHQKRAQLEIHFNWVFILIIGGVILGFFVTVINNQQKRSTTEEATELVETLDSVFNTINTNPDTVEVFDITNAEVEFTCETGLSQYYIQGAGPIDTRSEVIFTPNTLRGDSITTWTQTWHAPFETTVLTYIANDKTIFLFIVDNPDNSIAQLYHEMPDEFIKKALSPAQLVVYDTKGYDRYIIITNDDALQAPNSIKEHAHIRVITTNDLEGHYPITAKHYKGNTLQVENNLQILTRPLVWGAIFAEDKEFYECNLYKAVKRLIFVSDIMGRRAEAIANELVATRCYDFFSDAATELNTMASRTPNTNAATITAISSSIEELTVIQQLIERGPICPRLY